MIDPKAFFKISYGLYLVSAGDKNTGNAFVANTVFQVSADPVKFAICSHKDNYTTGVIQEKGVFAVSVLNLDTPAEIHGNYGFQSGCNVDKLEHAKVKYADTGVPIILDSTIAWFEFKVLETIDVGTHQMFIGELLNSELIDEKAEPLTYAYYHKVKNGLSPKNAPTYIERSALADKPKGKKYKCLVCGYEHELPEGQTMDDIPDDWTCPVCAQEKNNFIEV